MFKNLIPESHSGRFGQKRHLRAAPNQFQINEILIKI